MSNRFCEQYGLLNTNTWCNQCSRTYVFSKWLNMELSNEFHWLNRHLITWTWFFVAWPSLFTRPSTLCSTEGRWGIGTSSRAALHATSTRPGTNAPASPNCPLTVHYSMHKTTLREVKSAYEPTGSSGRNAFSFCSIKGLGVFLLPLDGMLVHCVHICTSGGREVQRILPGQGSGNWTARSGDERTNHQAIVPLVSFSAVTRVVTQKRCATNLITAAKETTVPLTRVRERCKNYRYTLFGLSS